MRLRARLRSRRFLCNVREITHRAEQHEPVEVCINSERITWLVADAERIAQSISGTSFRAPALAAVAGALAAVDPARARRLIGDAEHIAQSIPDANRKASALAAVAEGMAAIDPSHAERIAQSITSASSRAVALAAVAKALATTGPGGAAQSFTG